MVSPPRRGTIYTLTGSAPPHRRPSQRKEVQRTIPEPPGDSPTTGKPGGGHANRHSQRPQQPSHHRQACGGHADSPDPGQRKQNHPVCMSPIHARVYTGTQLQREGHLYHTLKLNGGSPLPEGCHCKNGRVPNQAEPRTPHRPRTGRPIQARAPTHPGPNPKADSD